MAVRSGLSQPVAVADAIYLADVTLSLDTNAYTSGDVIAATQEIADAMREEAAGGVLHSLVVIDNDDQGAAFDVYILDSNVAMGTENAAPNIADGDAAKILARIQVGTADYYDLGGVKVAELSGLNRIVKAASGSRSLWLAVVNGTGTPTYSAAGVVLRLGFLRG